MEIYTPRIYTPVTAVRQQRNYERRRSHSNCIKHDERSQLEVSLFASDAIDVELVILYNTDKLLLCPAKLACFGI